MAWPINAKRITFEYVMLKDVNDSDADARALVKLLAGIPAKINLIPFNPWPGAPYQCSDEKRMQPLPISSIARYASPVRARAGAILWQRAASLNQPVSNNRRRKKKKAELANAIWAASAIWAALK